MRFVHLMDRFGRRTMIFYYKWTEVDGGRTRTVHLMDGFGRRTIKILKMWTKVDGWTDGQKSVRGGLICILYAAYANHYYSLFIIKRYLFGFKDDEGQYKMRNFQFLQNRAGLLPEGTDDSLLVLTMSGDESLTIVQSGGEQMTIKY